MGQAELMWWFLNAFSVISRSRQMQAGTLISSVGTFFLKEGQKSIIEEIGDEVAKIQKLFGYNGDTDVVQQQKNTIQQQKDVMSNFMAQLKKSKLLKRGPR